MEQKRGQLTQRVKDKSKELLGYEITRDELRLMPYLQNVIMNKQYMKPEHINQEDREILSDWHKKKYIDRYSTAEPEHRIQIEITKEFWDIINEILYLAYVNIDK